MKLRRAFLICKLSSLVRVVSIKRRAEAQLAKKHIDDFVLLLLHSVANFASPSSNSSLLLSCTCQQLEKNTTTTKKKKQLYCFDYYFQYFAVNNIYSEKLTRNFKVFSSSAPSTNDRPSNNVPLKVQ